MEAADRRGYALMRATITNSRSHAEPMTVITDQVTPIANTIFSDCPCDFNICALHVFDALPLKGNNLEDIIL
jgi:hypothetical protein